MRRIGVVVSILFLLGIASVGIAQATPDRTVRATGDEQFVPNVKIMATLRWAPGPLTVKSGATVNWVSDTPDVPHTISIVAEADVPDGIEDLFDCPVCNAILAAHFPAGPPVPVVDVGAAGLDTVGDSLLLPPGGEVSTVISAPAGSRLNYICAIHPWMIGAITVN
jgi:plastocyanin